MGIQDRQRAVSEEEPDQAQVGVEHVTATPVSIDLCVSLRA